MILDSGICSIFEKVNSSSAGHMPVYTYTLKAMGWYGRLDFTTSPTWATERREETQVSMKIRILQNTAINNHDIVVLGSVSAVPDDAVLYEVVKAFHGAEDGTGTPITDLSLEVVTP